ncbi:hypothetical protein IM538_08720 [Cytobacillus suaedae]|nr:hypothetical protein IM538_08720 [Cytobacillus suaedae]
MEKYLLPIAIVILSAAIVFAGLQFGQADEQSSHSGQFNSMDKGLMSIEETAEYLNLTVEELEAIIRKQDLERSTLDSFATYQFIPYITIEGEMHFSKYQLEEWIKYSSISWAVIQD